ncbi:phage holin family protein [Ideonella sp. A 288]|uniref:phage holin family protein n=1 Tax=Ideonella sp. A 288 TaxID=1962181 RepID=UPI0011865F0A|nr:phage holin family protein [Ideonella sp. A 288]
MTSPQLTMLGLGVFILVFGGLTLWITWRVLGGLRVQWRQRGQARRLAAAEGWRYAGHDQFTCKLGEREWRGGPHQDEDDGQRWTDFEGGVPGVSPGGFVVVSRKSWQRSRAKWRQRQSQPAPDNMLFRAEAAIEDLLHRATGRVFEPSLEHPDDDRVNWTPQEVGSAAFSERWVLLASEPLWAAVWTPAVDALWLRAHALRDGEIHAHAQHHFLSLKRDDGKTEPTLDEVAALLRLGHALMQTTQAVASPRAPAGVAAVDPA